MDDEEDDEDDAPAEDAAPTPRAATPRRRAKRAAAEVASAAARVEGRRGKDPPIQDVVKRGQEMLVQVSKEPISTKGPRVTAQISLAGRFLVYMPSASRVGVSRKIGARGARAAARDGSNVLPKDSGGVIVRTVGEEPPRSIQARAGCAPRAVEADQEEVQFVRAPASCTARRA